MLVEEAVQLHSEHLHQQLHYYYRSSVSDSMTYVIDLLSHCYCYCCCCLQDHHSLLLLHSWMRKQLESAVNWPPPLK